VSAAGGAIARCSAAATGAPVRGWDALQEAQSSTSRVEGAGGPWRERERGAEIAGARAGAGAGSRSAGRRRATYLHPLARAFLRYLFP